MMNRIIHDADGFMSFGAWADAAIVIRKESCKSKGIELVMLYSTFFIGPMILTLELNPLMGHNVFVRM